MKNVKHLICFAANTSRYNATSLMQKRKWRWLIHLYQNLQRVIAQMEEERRLREQQRHHLDQDRILKEKELNIKRVDLEQLQHHQENTKEQISADTGIAGYTSQ